MKTGQMSLIVALLYGCTTNLGFEKRDGHPDTGVTDTADQTELDVAWDEVMDPTVDPTDTFGDTQDEDGHVAVCGNGSIEEGEDCDQDGPVDCDTTCGTVGSRSCVGCAWGDCVPPAEICNDVDDDCDDLTDESGTLVIHGGPARISSDPATSAVPSMAIGDTGIAVVWQDDRSGHQEIHFARVSASGTIHTNDLAITATSTHSMEPHVSFGRGDMNIAVSHVDSGATGIWVLAADEDGAVTTAMRQVSTAGSQPAHRPSIFATAAGYLVSWDTGSSVYGLKLNPAGIPSGAPQEYGASSAPSMDATLVMGEVGAAIVWTEDATSDLDVMAVLVNSDATVSVAEQVLVAGPAGASSPDMVWTGSSYAVAWQDDRAESDAVYLSWLGADGTPGDLPSRVTGAAGDARQPALAWTGSGYGVAWVDDADGGWILRVVMASPSGVPLLAPLAVSDGTGSASHPDILWDGSYLVVSWQDDRDGNDEIYFASIDLSACP